MFLCELRRVVAFSLHHFADLGGNAVVQAQDGRQVGEVYYSPNEWLRSSLRSSVVFLLKKADTTIYRSSPNPPNDGSFTC